MRDARVLEHARDGLGLAHRDRHRVGVELAEDGVGDALAQRLDQLVLLVRRHVLHHLVDALVVDGLADAVAAARRPQVALDGDVEQHRAPAAALRGRHAEGGEDLDPFEKDDVRHTAELNARRLTA